MHLSFRFAIILGLVATLATSCQDHSTEVGKSFKKHVPTQPQSDKVPNAPTPPSAPSVPSAKPTTPDLPQTPVTAPEVKPAEARAEQEKCSPKKEGKSYLQSDCASGLVCAPNVSDLSAGTCRVPCGELVKGKSKKVDGVCGSSRTCQLTTSLTLDDLGAYCLPQQTKRDGACSAMGDKQACSQDRICAVSELKKDKKDQPVATSFICRDACAFATAKAKDTCSSGEECVAYPYDSTSQSTEAGEPVMCTESKCTGDLSECECDKANGFQCTALIPGVIAFCDRPAGICTTPVGFAAAADFAEGRFAGERCNEVKGHAFCNNGLFDGVEKGGEAMCVTLSEKSGDGFCYAFCSAPAIDLDGDGELKGRELGQKFACPANYTCNRDLGRMLGMVASVGDKSTPNGKKTCDPAKCEVGKPCLSECGIGEAECLSYPTKAGGFTSFCGAPFGNCELSITPK